MNIPHRMFLNQVGKICNCALITIQFNTHLWKLFKIADKS